MRDDPLIGLRIDATHSSNGVVIAMHGELDLATVGMAATVLDDLCDSSTGQVCIELTDLEFLGFAGVHMLRDLQRRVVARGRSLSIVPISRSAARAMALSDDLARAGAPDARTGAPDEGRCQIPPADPLLLGHGRPQQQRPSESHLWATADALAEPLP